MCNTNVSFPSCTNGTSLINNFPFKQLVYNTYTHKHLDKYNITKFNIDLLNINRELKHNSAEYDIKRSSFDLKLNFTVFSR